MGRSALETMTIHRTEKTSDSESASEPMGYCPRCDYALLAPGRCPECGVEISPAHIRSRPRALRRRRWIRRVSVIAVVALAGWGGLRFHRSGAWRRYVPTSMLMAWREDSVEAEKELIRRLRDGELSDAEADALVSTLFALEIENADPLTTTTPMRLEFSLTEASPWGWQLVTSVEYRVLIDGQAVKSTAEVARDTTIRLLFRTERLTQERVDGQDHIDYEIRCILDLPISGDRNHVVSHNQNSPGSDRRFVIAKSGTQRLLRPNPDSNCDAFSSALWPDYVQLQAVQRRQPGGARSGEIFVTLQIQSGMGPIVAELQVARASTEDWKPGPSIMFDETTDGLCKTASVRDSAFSSDVDSVDVRLIPRPAERRFVNGMEPTDCAFIWRGVPIEVTDRLSVSTRRREIAGRPTVVTPFRK